MLSIFKTNQLLFCAFLIPYIILLRGSVFYFPDTWQPAIEGIFSAWMYDWIGSTSNLSIWVAMLFIFLQAVIINQMVIEHRLATEINLFPGLFYVLVVSSLPDFLHLSPILMGNTFFIIAIRELISIYKKNTVADKIFNVGFWIAIASLFYFSFTIFIILGFVGLFILRSLNIKEFLMVVLGFFVPYILLTVYCFWFDLLPFFQQTQFVQNLGFMDFQFKNNWVTYVKLVFFILLLGGIFLSFNIYMLKKNIQVQKKISILYWAILLSPLSLLIQAGVQLEHLLIISVAASILLSLNFTQMSRQWSETLHLLLLMVVLICQFSPFIFKG